MLVIFYRFGLSDCDVSERRRQTFLSAFFLCGFLFLGCCVFFDSLECLIAMRVLFFLNIVIIELQCVYVS